MMAPASTVWLCEVASTLFVAVTSISYYFDIPAGLGFEKIMTPVTT